MKPHRSACFLSFCATFVFVGLASGQIVFDVNFESPTYTLGNANGQDNWSAPFGFNDIVNTKAHGGTQSFRTTSGPGGARAFEVPPFTFDVSVANDFWLETYVYVVPSAGSTASFGVGNVLGAAFGFGISDSGTVSFNGGSVLGTTRELGSVVLDKWLRMRVEHLASSPTFLHMTLTGQGVDESANVGYSAAASVQSYLSVDMRNLGVAYWDDMKAAYGPAPVPEPGVVALVGVSAGLFSLRRRHGSRVRLYAKSSG